MFPMFHPTGPIFLVFVSIPIQSVKELCVSEEKSKLRDFTGNLFIALGIHLFLLANFPECAMRLSGAKISGPHSDGAFPLTSNLVSIF
jgi:hypothetical protein